jgi:hypothetical protein
VLAFACPVCERLVTFESSVCLHCGSELGFDISQRTLRAVSTSDPRSNVVRCVQSPRTGCNWLASCDGELCASCQLTRTRPNDSDGGAIAELAVAEAAKRRLLFALAELELPVVGWYERPGGLGFDLLSSAQGKVVTGHSDGIITLDLDETDPAHREQMRVRLGEPYRTVLGHFRHEIGHYFQPLLVPAQSAASVRCREIFGDEREDYQSAMDRYYEAGAPAGWEQAFVSAYATMHPWEDWAETFAHYLHIRDALQTAAAYGIRTDGPAIATADSAPLQSKPAEATGDIRVMLDAWLPLTYALNAVNRSMGTGDLYPFVLTSAVEDKLGFIDALVRSSTQDR